MAFDGKWNAIPAVVQGSDLSAATSQFKFVKFSSTTQPQVGLCSASTDTPCGVLQSNTPNATTGEPATVASDGVVKVQSDGTVQVGSLVATDANGRATVASTTQQVVGMCIDTTGNVATVAGDLITVNLDCRSPYKKA